ncbi:MAG: hypothetical protein LAP87_12015 [Acidobacteriia bacterium]|nr:hypothetical protein [Terriglobia bacterium]
MNVRAWHEELIGKRHDREAFDCGETALNEFLQRYARRNHEMGGAKTFLAIDDAGNKTILGFYSLSPAFANPRRNLYQGDRLADWPEAQAASDLVRVVRDDDAADGCGAATAPRPREDPHSGHPCAVPRFRPPPE